MAKSDELYSEGMRHYRNRSWENAAYNLKQATSMGHAQASYYLGELYRSGLGVEKSLPRAILYFRTAEARGVGAARTILSKIEAENAPVKRVYYLIDIKQLGELSEAKRARLRQRDPKMLSELRDLDRNMYGVYPYAALLLISYGIEYYSRYVSSGDASVFQKAIAAVEDCFGRCLKYMLEHYKETCTTEKRLHRRPFFYARR